MKRSGFQREIEPPVPQRESHLSFANPLSGSRRASTEMRLPRFCRCEDIPTLRCHNDPCPYHPSVGHARTSVPAPLILLPVPQKPRWTHFVSFALIPPLPLGTASGEFLRPAASDLLLFRFLPKTLRK
jgi:hypothetical protein